MTLDTPKAIVNSDTIDTLVNRVTVRDYTSEDVDEETMRILLNAARRTATSSNLQTYSFVVVRDPAKKEILAELAGNQKHIIDAPVFVAICADISRLKQAAQLHDTGAMISLETSMVAIVDAAIAGQSLSLAAESIGLGTVMIGGMRNHPQEVAEVLNLPDGVFVVYGMCIGHPAERKPQKPRLPESAIIKYEQYSHVDNDTLQEHDAELSEHYRNMGRKTIDAAWTGFAIRKIEKPSRPHLKDVLTSRGFSFD